MVTDPNPGAKPTGGERQRKVAEWAVFVIPTLIIVVVLLVFLMWRFGHR
jgi:hypothetical protein